ncbi:site-2 protease family protein [Candidatus Micrarchaeota archaeon]|nr:site-2 protease family protein [Candidatus Micrarchaeota archaeon]
MMILLLIIAIALILFYLIVFQLDIPGLWKFALVAAEMVAVNRILISRYKLPSELGLVLVKSKEGIKAIDRLAKGERAFNFMADVGAAMSYGLLSVKLMRKNISAASLGLGLALLVVLSVFVAPIALSFLLYVVGIGSGGSGSAAQSVGGSVDMGLLLIGGILLAGGLFLLILFGIVYYGIVIFKALVMSLFFGTDAISKVSPGGDFLLPGINLPFFEGIIALAVVMAVHEGAHAILTRIAKVPLLSSGIVLFGIIPIGAFVEPDEKRLARAEPVRQTRVLVAGPTANMLASLAFFILLMGFFLTTADMRGGVFYVQYNDTNASANITRPLPAGTLVYEIDGIPADQIDFNAPPYGANESIKILTNKGEVVRMTDSDGKIGLQMYYLGKDFMFSRYANPAMQFLYVVLGLCTALNFVVGTVNILPIPLFDGFRIIDVNVKNKMVVKAISYGALFFFILNFLPRLFQ